MKPQLSQMWTFRLDPTRLLDLASVAVSSTFAFFTERKCLLEFVALSYLPNEDFTFRLEIKSSVAVSHRFSVWL